jgi:putative membrane protein
MMVTFWALVIGALVAVIRAGGAGGADAPTRRQAPEEILAERLARGEIDEDDYHQRLDTLHGLKLRQPHKTDTR